MPLDMNKTIHNSSKVEFSRQVITKTNNEMSKQIGTIVVSTESLILSLQYVNLRKYLYNLLKNL